MARGIHLREVAGHPALAAVVAQADEQRKDIHRGGQPRTNLLNVAGQAPTGIKHEQRHIIDLLIAGAHFPGHEPVRAGVLTVIGGQDDDRIAGDLRGQGVED